MYNGVVYRSRTEARWAKFFDLINVSHYYEPEGFSLKSGYYLPDFLLKRGDYTCYAEVKPVGGFHKNALDKAFDLCADTGRPVLLLEGPPDTKEFFCFHPSNFGCEKKKKDECIYPHCMCVHQNKVILFEIIFNLDKFLFVREADFSGNIRVPTIYDYKTARAIEM